MSTERDRRAARIAVTDQAMAAYQDALDLAGSGDTAYQINPPPGFRKLQCAVTAALAQTALSDRDAVAVCEHIDAQSGSARPSFWLVGGPGRLLCLGCFVAALPGVRQCHRCRCSDLAALIRIVLPPEITELPTGKPIAVPPIIVVASVCTRCWEQSLAADDQTRGRDDDAPPPGACSG